MPPGEGLGFRADQKITEVLGHGEFTVSAEVIPPRNGVEQHQVLEQIQSLIGAGAQFLSVTKGAGGSLRGGSLPIAQAIKEQFKVPCIAHFTCRDLTPQEVENQLMDHHYFGVRNILALRGDPPNNQPDWTPREGSHDYAFQLIEQIKRLNSGDYLPRPGGNPMDNQDRTDFCIGAAAYPEHPDPKERLEFFRKKIDAGAEYGITQMIFDAEAYARFRELCEKDHIRAPIIPGTRILKSQKAAQRMSNLFQVSVPQALVNSLPEKSTPESFEQTVEISQKLVEKLKSYGAPGIHLFVLSDTRGSCELLKRLAD